MCVSNYSFPVFKVFSGVFKKHTHRFDPRSGGILQLKHELCCIGVKDVDGPLISGANPVIRVAACHN